MFWDEVIQFTARQHGLVSTRQVASTGATDDWLTWAVTDGLLTPVRRGVYAAAGAPASPFRELMAAILAGGDGVAAGGLAAGWVWGAADILPGALELVAFRGRLVRLRGVLVRKTRLDPAGLVVVRNHIPVVTPPLAVAQIAPMSIDLAINVANDLVKRRHTTFGAIDAALRGPVGARLPERLRLYCSRAASTDGHDDSPAARRLAEALIAAGVPPFVTQYPVSTAGGDFRLDFAWPGPMVGLEYNGWADHGSIRPAFDNDARRRSFLTAAGWRLLDVTSAASFDQVIRWVIATLAVRYQ
jgi:putative AbiEi antitoxin of type IV toxin-antitoxin system